MSMENKYIDVGKKWGVVVNYDYDLMDYDEMWAIMRSFGLTSKNANKALKILSNYNTGMTITNDDLKMSTIFISKASTPSEWWNTAIHELKHVADAIISYYDVEWDSEDAAYLTGYMTKQLVESVGEPCYD